MVGRSRGRRADPRSVQSRGARPWGGSRPLACSTLPYLQDPCPTQSPHSQPSSAIVTRVTTPIYSSSISALRVPGSNSKSIRAVSPASPASSAPCAARKLSSVSSRCPLNSNRIKPICSMLPATCGSNSISLCAPPNPVYFLSINAMARSFPKRFTSISAAITQPPFPLAVLIRQQNYL